MASVVALKPFSVSLGGVPQLVLPAMIFRDRDYSAQDYANLLAAGAAVQGGNGLTSWDSPHAALVAAQAQVQALRLAGGDVDNAGEVIMLDAAALDTASGVSSGTAALVAGSAIVTVPPPPDGSFAVPVGSKVYGTITTKTGKTALLIAVRISNTQIQLSTHLTPGYDPLLESAGTGGTLVASAVDIALANAAGDRLAVALVTPGGTPGVLSVKRKDNATVTVESWEEPTFAAGTLVAGTLTVALANDADDKLSVVRTASHGTDGVLSVESVDAANVKVTSWVDPGGVQVLDLADFVVENAGAGPGAGPDTSDVIAYNFAQSANETSLVRWAVIRP